MIKIVANLYPYGTSKHPPPLAIITIFTEPGNATHGYTISIEGQSTLRGDVPKDRSGHRNLLHVLGLVLDDVKENHDLGLDYITTSLD